MAVKISTLELENVKRIKAVQLTPAKNGLTVIGGKNKQGKTSVLDSIAWALGGDRYKPTSPKREGSFAEPHLKVTLDNGIVVERFGKNGSLKVIDSTGNRGGQQLLDGFIEKLALDLPKFMNQTNKDKAATLLKIIGVGDKLYELENREQTLYNQRTTIGRIADQKAKFAKEMPVYTSVPTEPVSPSELIKQQQEILARNGENQRKRDNLARLEAAEKSLAERLSFMEQELEKAKAQYQKTCEDLVTARKSTAELCDESTAELEASIADIEELNRKIRANLDREKAQEDANFYVNEYDSLTVEIESIRRKKLDLLKNADLPLEGLAVEGGELTYNGYKWDSMSGSEQLMVATSIVRKLKPECGFVLLDKLEQMDTDTLESFGKWLEAQGLQAIATRVSTGGECSIIIEDGMSAQPQEEKMAFKNWNGGNF